MDYLPVLCRDVCYGIAIKWVLRLQNWIIHGWGVGGWRWWTGKARTLCSRYLCVHHSSLVARPGLLLCFALLCRKINHSPDCTPVRFLSSVVAWPGPCPGLVYLLRSLRVLEEIRTIRYAPMDDIRINGG